MYMCLLPPIVCLVMEWGLALGGARAAALARDDLDALSCLLGEVFSAKIILAIVCILGALALYPFIPSAAIYPQAYFLAILLGLIRGVSPLWFYQGVGQGAKRLAIQDVLSSLVALGLIFPLIDSPENWGRYFSVTAICKGIPYLGLNLELYFIYRPRLGVRAGVGILKKTRALFAGSFFSLIYNNGSQLVLGYFLSAAQMGIMVAVVKMIRAVGALLAPFTQTIFPEMCVLTTLDPGKSRRILRQSLAGLFLLMLLCSCALFFLAPYIIRIALGPGYEAAIDVFRIMIFAAPALACDYALGAQTLVPRGLESRMIRAQALAAGVSLILAAALPTLAGLSGAAQLPVITEILLAAGYFYIIRKRCPEALFANSSRA